MHGERGPRSPCVRVPWPLLARPFPDLIRFERDVHGLHRVTVLFQSPTPRFLASSIALLSTENLAAPTFHIEFVDLILREEPPELHRLFHDHLFGKGHATLVYSNESPVYLNERLVHTNEGFEHADGEPGNVRLVPRNAG